jgi:hypothetical protein
MCIHVLGQRNHLFCKMNTQMHHFRVKSLQTFAVRCPTVFCVFEYPCIGAKKSQPKSDTTANYTSIAEYTRCAWAGGTFFGCLRKVPPAHVQRVLPKGTY